MFFVKEESKSGFEYDTDTVNTVIGPESEFSGTLSTQGSIRVDGVVKGDIISQGEVVVGEKSIVQANIVAKRVIIAGEVKGNIEATRSLKICETGRVYGDISGARLIIEEGAIYKGKVNMDVVSAENAYEGRFELFVNEKKVANN